MKDNSKSGLCINQAISIILIIIILSTHIQLFVSKQGKIQLATINIDKEEIKLEETQTNEREIQIASRTYQERTVEENKEKYITIDEITISKDMDLTKTTGISKEDFKVLMTNLNQDTSLFFKNNSDIIYDLCKKYELNEIFFCGLIAAESGWNIASNHRNKNNYISMMSNGKLIYYSSVEEGLEAAAKLLHNRYLSEDGSYYYGKTLDGVQKCFCPESTWVNLVYSCMEQIVK